MAKKFKRMSRDQQELIYAALINNYASYLESKDTTPEKMKHRTYWKDKAKEKLKTMYTKATREVRTEKPLETFNKRVAETLNEIIPKEYILETKVDIITNDIDYNLRDFIADLAIELGSTQYFSLALKCCSMEKARLFITYCIDFFLDNEIPMDEKLRENLIKNEHDQYVYACLKNKVCAICGTKYNIHFEHYITVASDFGTYAKDDGSGTYWSLCEKCHFEKHNMSLDAHFRKYEVKGIKLTPEQAIEIKKIYPNHLKAL